MKVLVLNGSPHPNGATADMVSAFEKGAKEAGHEVIIFAVARMNVKGCLGCEYCHNKGKGKCVQQDDMKALYPEFLSADMVVFASPIYYFTLSAQLQAVIHRTYAFGIPKNVKQTALILSSGDAFVYGPAITQYYQSIENTRNEANNLYGSCVRPDSRTIGAGRGTPGVGKLYPVF